MTRVCLGPLANVPPISPDSQRVPWPSLPSNAICGTTSLNDSIVSATEYPRRSIEAALIEKIGQPPTKTQRAALLGKLRG